METNDFQPIFRDSAETLRFKRVSRFSFSKASRFTNKSKPEDFEFGALPSTLNRRGTSLGYGRRWEPDTRTKEFPSPGSYEVSGNILLNTGIKYKENSKKFKE